MASVADTTTILVRADASAAIGAGHVMRCLSLAHALRKQKATVEFVMSEIGDALAGHVEAQGFVVHRLASRSTPADHLDATAVRSDAEATARLVSARGAASVVVDNYSLDAHWESLVRETGAVVIAVDDFAQREHVCDLLLDQNVIEAGPDASGPYEGIEASRLLLGPRFALLRSEFALAHCEAVVRKGPVRRILVSLGGADPDGFTLTVLRALAETVDPTVHVEVVVAPMSLRSGEIAEAVVAAGWVPHIGTADMLGLMVSADVGIGAAGSTMWERCCVGLPSLAVSLAKNQEPIAAACQHAGVAVDLGRSSELGAADLTQKLVEVLADCESLAFMSSAALSLVDGLGADRVASRILEVMHR